jgi:hypothetical protein
MTNPTMLEPTPELPDETLINDVAMPPMVVKQATAQLSWG